MRLLIISLAVLTAYIFLVRVFHLFDVYETMEVWFYGFLILTILQLFSLVFFKVVLGSLIYTAFVLLVFLVVMPSGVMGYALSVSTGPSNKPTVRDPDLVITKNFALNYERGVMVGALVNDSLYIKRIHGMPHDHITICDGEVFVNGYTFQYVNKWVGAELDNPLLCNREYRKIKLSEGEFFLLGDNLNTSIDSRNFGPIQKSAITLNYLFVLRGNELRNSTSLTANFIQPQSNMQLKQ